MFPMDSSTPMMILDAMKPRSLGADLDRAAAANRSIRRHRRMARWRRLRAMVFGRGTAAHPGADCRAGKSPALPEAKASQRACLT